MKWWSRASGSLVAAIVLVACGRLGDDDASSGGTGGLGTGGEIGASGSGGSGATGTGGTTAVTGGTSSGGAIARGGASSGGGGGLGSGQYVPLGKSSWDVAMAVTVTSNKGLFSCKSASFTLHLEPNGNGLKVISGRDGSVLVGDLASSGGTSPSYRATNPLSLPSVGDCEVSSILVSELEVRGWDDGFDGGADFLQGDGKGSVSLSLGDVSLTSLLQFHLSGARDTHAPTLVAPGSVHPLDGVSVQASEPVALGTTMVLSSAARDVALTGYDSGEGALGSFSTPVVLPFGSNWSIKAVGQDLADLDFTANSALVQLVADPGLFAQDGFETAPHGLLTTGTGAQVVTSVGNLPAIAGTKSLLVPPGASATLHLARPAGVTSVLFSMQALSNTSGAPVNAPPILVGVVGDPGRWAPPAPSTTISTATGDVTWPYASVKREVSVPVGQTGTDVVIRIAPARGCLGICPPPQLSGSEAILIDDLRLN